MEMKRPFMIFIAVAIAATSRCQVPHAPQLEAELSGQFSTSAARPAQNHKSELLNRTDQALLKQAKFLIPKFKPYAGVPDSLSLSNSRSGENAIRSNAHAVYALASIYATIKDGYPDGITRKQCKETAIKSLRFLLYTHGAGGMKCADGRHWSGQWQSPLWANSASKAAWLLWDELPPDLRWLAARMVADEADRFVGKNPPAQIFRDTKAEENAWNSAVISLAHCMLPKHKHHDVWRTTAITWVLSSFARKADLNSTQIIDGKPVKDWLVGASIHDDFTLENHDRVHPDYMNSTRMIVKQALAYEWAGLKPPDALAFNTKQVYKVLKTLATPDGSYLYPNGQDWQLHRNAMWLDNHAANASLFNDAEGARLLQIGLDCVEKMQARDPNGGVYLAEEFSFSSTQQYVAEMLADVRHMLAEAGTGPKPVSESELLMTYSGRHVFETGMFALLRTPHSISSFSWGKQPMAMVMPLDQDLLLSPNERSMIGTVETRETSKEKPVMRQFNLTPAASGFGIAGVMDRAGGAISQHFAFAALPDGRTIYIDRLVATSSTEITKLVLGQLCVLNDKNWVFHDGKRTLDYANGHQELTALGPDNVTPHEFDSKWFNLDGKLGIVCLKTSGRQTYHPNHKQGNGRLEQVFSLNSPTLKENSTTAAGQTIAETTLVFYPAGNLKGTKELSAACSLSQPEATTYNVRLKMAPQ